MAAMLSPEEMREYILNSPALMPPPGIEANFIDPPTIKSQVRGVLISMLILSTIVVAVRMYTKLVVVKLLALEDYLIAAGWILYAAGYQAVNFLSSALKGPGGHQWNVLVKDLIPILYYMEIASAIYGLVVLQIKAAIILQCLHVLVPTGVRTATYYVLWTLLWAHAIFYIACTFIEIFMCNPRAKIWDPTIQGGHCMNKLAVNIAAAAINTASDLILVVIPQIIIWRLNLPVHKKWAVSVVFLIGLLACTASAVRMYYSIELLTDKDFTWVATFMGMWVEVEVCCGFLVACLPVFPRFFKNQAVFSTMASNLRSLLRIRNSSSAKYASERLGSSDASRPKKEAMVTDIEFEELVMRTDMSMVSGHHHNP